MSNEISDSSIVTNKEPRQQQMFIDFPDHPISMACHHCGSQVHTKTSKEIGLANWMGAGVIALMGAGFLCIYSGCCLVPFCIDSLKDVGHYCPECSLELGRHKIVA